MQEWMVRTRSRIGTCGAVYYGTQTELDRLIRAALARGDEVEEHHVLPTSPASDSTGDEPRRDPRKRRGPPDRNGG